MKSLEEVIKAVEYCLNPADALGNCQSECPYIKECDPDSTEIKRDALHYLKSYKEDRACYEKLDEKDMTIDDVCKAFNLADICDFSDGYHTFNSLYRQRAYLFATIVKQNKDKAWKSRKHEDGEPCFGGGWFIVGIDTPKGSYTYHYEDNLWSMFDCQELPVGKHWDGHTDEDVDRLLSLE